MRTTSFGIANSKILRCPFLRVLVSIRLRPRIHTQLTHSTEKEHEGSSEWSLYGWVLRRTYLINFLHTFPGICGVSSFREVALGEVFNSLFVEVLDEPLGGQEVLKSNFNLKRRGCQDMGNETEIAHTPTASRVPVGKVVFPWPVGPVRVGWAPKTSGGGPPM